MTAEQAIRWLTLKPKDLPVFVLIATDPIAPDAIDQWILHAKVARVRAAKIAGAAEVIFDFELWPEKKLPG